MRRLWVLIGRVFHWLSRPFLMFYLRGSRRTRVILSCGDEILMVKGWYGSGRWSLPGGGLHKNEDPAIGASRELLEETGIVMDPRQLEFLTQIDRKTNAVTYKIEAYFVNIDQKPSTKKQKIEIVDLKWVKWREAYEDPNVQPYIKELLRLRFLT